MTVLPDYNAFKTAYEADAPQLVYTRFPSDMLTPVAALLALRELSPYHFLLESVEGGKTRGRYSILCLKPDLLWTCRDGVASIQHVDEQNRLLEPEISLEHPFASLRTLIADSDITIPDELPPMATGLFGYMGYDMVRLMEHIPMPEDKEDPINVPDSVFLRPQLVMIFDSVKDEAYLITPVFPNEADNAETAYHNASSKLELALKMLDHFSPPCTGIHTTEPEAPVLLETHTSYEDYCQTVEKAKEAILAGDIFQMVPSRRLSGEFTYDPLSFYRSLRHLNPSPFLFYLAIDDFVITGSSPEILVRVRDQKVTVRPIAGTRKRGKDAAEDKALAEDLLSDPKELAEHLMLIDLGRNDVGRVSEVNSVKVTEQMVIEYYSHVMHIVSNVEGTLKKDCDVIDALASGFPAGTVSGAPKIRAMELIDQFEKEKRSFYAGAVGYLSRHAMDTCIALRTALIKDQTLYLQAGGGIVADSDPDLEFQETHNKAAALQKAANLAFKFEKQ